MTKRTRSEEQERAEDHLKDLLNLNGGLSPSELKWIDIFANRMNEGDVFSDREREIIYEKYDR